MATGPEEEGGVTTTQLRTPLSTALGLAVCKTLTHKCPEIFLNTTYTDAKSLPMLANGGLLIKTTAVNTPQPLLWRSMSLFSRMPKLKVETDRQNQLCVPNMGRWV